MMILCGQKLYSSENAMNTDDLIGFNRWFTGHVFVLIDNSCDLSIKIGNSTGLPDKQPFYGGLKMVISWDLMGSKRASGWILVKMVI